MLAHIVVPWATLPLLGAWAAVVLGVLAGLVLLIADLHHRRLGAVVLLVFAAASAAVGAITPWPPGAAPYRVSVVSPSAGEQVTSPLAITVCGRNPDGSAAAVPGADRVVSVSVDGRQVLSAASDSLAVFLRPGSHRVRVEVLTARHVRFSPPDFVDVAVTVSSATPGSPATPRCSRR